MTDELDDDFDCDGWCEYCYDDGDRQLANGDCICISCLIDRYNATLAEEDKKPGSATSKVIEHVQKALTNEYKHVPTGRIIVDLMPDDWWAFLKEQGIE